MSEYGLIGQSIRYSYSKLIHEDISPINYDLIQLANNIYVDEFLASDFKAVNVTRPYKEQAYNRCDVLSKEAEETKVVNLIKKIDNKLYGHNTDVFGFEYLLDINNIKVKDKNCIILGTGATSKTIDYVLKNKKTKNISFLSRSPKEINQYSYTDDVINSAEIIINTTPISMNNYDLNNLIDFTKCKKLEVFIDINYRPNITNLMWDAIRLGIKAYNGLPMLVAQAIKANEIFLDTKYDDYFYESELNKIANEIMNITLIGHPFAGKSTIGAILANKLNMKFVDIDQEIESIKEMNISDIFNEYGEEHFRYLETNVIKNNCLNSGTIISTGGGAVLSEDNMRYLKMTSIIINIERNIENIETSKNRPLVKNKKDLENIIKQRENLYKRYSDISIKNNGNIKDCIEEILKLLWKYM